MFLWGSSEWPEITLINRFLPLCTSLFYMDHLIFHKCRRDISFLSLIYT